MKINFLSAVTGVIGLFALTMTAHAGPDKATQGFSKDLYLKGDIAFPVHNKLTDNSAFEAKHHKFRAFGLLSLGKRLNSNYSLEFESFYRRFDIKERVLANINKYFLTSYGAFLNAVVHPPQIQINKFYPFFGGGIGFGYNDPGSLVTQSASGASAIKGKKTHNVRYQLFFGADYKINPKFRLTTEIRWVDFNRIQHKSSNSEILIKNELKTLALCIGAKYKF